MPLFGSQKKTTNVERKRSNNLVDNPPKPTPPLPPPPDLPQQNGMKTQSNSHSMFPSRQELVFHTQLAHGSATKEIKDFSNIKELYSRIATVFGIEPTEIIFCTLNTHKADMTRLLGGQIGLEDFIFAHIKGHTKQVTVNKTEEALGLTITDNGAGHAFVKRIKDRSTISKVPEVSVGDMLESINGRSMIGSRHYEVAKLLKELPRYVEITLRLVEPRKAFDAIAPRSKGGGASVLPVLDGDTDKLEEVVAKGEGRATLRLKKDGQAIVEEVLAWESKAAERVDDFLESYMGIRDNELAQTMVDLGKDKKEADNFIRAMNEHLGEFEFPVEFMMEVWTAIDTVRSSPQS